MTAERRHLWLSLWYNHPGPAFPLRPDLGNAPHAQVAMKALGITYAASVPHSVYDGWAFYDCQNVPDELPQWLTPTTLSDHWADACGIPRATPPDVYGLEGR